MRRIKRFTKALKLAGKSLLCCKKTSTDPVIVPSTGDTKMSDKILLVGINAYPSCPLAGCVNDVTDMANFLVTKCGVLEDNIRLLVDGRATTGNILDRLNWLTQASPGDRVLFHYSGHGAQVPARNSSGEIDQLSECICPVDFDWSEQRMIIDKQFVEIFKKIPPGVRFSWISDSCHSGDLDRGLTKGNSKVLGIRRFPIPADIAWRQRIAKKKALRAMVGNTLDVGYISGCMDNQTSADAEFGGKANGALTYFLLRNLGNMLQSPISSVTNKVISDLQSSGYEQTPTCSGARKDLAFLS